MASSCIDEQWILVDATGFTVWCWQQRGRSSPLLGTAEDQSSSSPPPTVTSPNLQRFTDGRTVALQGRQPGPDHDAKTRPGSCGRLSCGDVMEDQHQWLEIIRARWLESIPEGHWEYGEDDKRQEDFLKANRELAHVYFEKHFSP